jgi:hypothetical protein
LTQSGFTASNTSSLLYISEKNATVKISRLHFKGGTSTMYGGAIYNNGTLTLESCIFSGNQTTNTSSGGGAAVRNNSSCSLTVLGCTFYNNTAGYSGVIYGPVTMLTGNVFYGNFGKQSKVVHPANFTATSGGYNVSEGTVGKFNTNTNKAGSGYDAATGDLFEVTDITFATDGDPTTAPSSASNLKTLTSLPKGFPATYFDGTSRDTPATAGAVKAAASQ